MRILVTGKEGQLGWELTRALQTFGEVIPVGREQMDLAQPDSIRAVIRGTRPALIVNAAAYTAVDRAEIDTVQAHAINGIGPGIIAEEAKRIGAGLIHYSTDYVFAGSKQAPYTEMDATGLCNVYGRSKRDGEQAVLAVEGAHLVLRTSSVYGTRGKNFLQTILRLAHEGGELRIVADQFGTPTWSRLIALATAHILATGKPLPSANGVYHLTASGYTSWFGLAEAIFRGLPKLISERLHASCSLVPIMSSEYAAAAQRPSNSQLSCDQLQQDFRVSLPDWATGLRLCLQELGG